MKKKVSKRFKKVGASLKLTALEMFKVLSGVTAVSRLNTGQSGETWSWSLHSYRL